MISNKKDWSTKGKILAKERPKDSLLIKAMDFAPIPDKEFTDKLEKMKLIKSFFIGSSNISQIILCFILQLFSFFHLNNRYK